MSQRLLQLIKRIAYNPTRAERFTYADVILQQLTAMVKTEKTMMSVMKRRAKSGILLGYNPEFIAGLTDDQVCTMLCHETQHLRTKDLERMLDWGAPRDWYNGWDGHMLFNVARDCQINDELLRIGMAKVPGGCFGPEIIGHTTEGVELEHIMRVVAKNPPPPQDTQGQQDLDTSELGEADGQEAEEVQVGRNVSPAGPKCKSTVHRDAEQSRFDNFLAETLDTRRNTDSWFRTPKRLSGIRTFAEREANIVYRQPSPRKSALIAIDVSGSIDEQGVQRLCGLVRSAPSSYDLTVICFDDGCSVWHDFRQTTDRPPGGGGTDFDLIETFAKGMMRYPDAVVVLTDGQAPTPQVSNPGRWTWVLYDANVESCREDLGMRCVPLDAIIKRSGR